MKFYLHDNSIDMVTEMGKAFLTCFWNKNIELTTPYIDIISQ